MEKILNSSIGCLTVTQIPQTPPPLPPCTLQPPQPHSLCWPSSSSSSSSAGWWKRQTSSSSVLPSPPSIPRTSVHSLSSWAQTRTHTQHTQQEEDSRRKTEGGMKRRADGAADGERNWILFNIWALSFLGCCIWKPDHEVDFLIRWEFMFHSAVCLNFARRAWQRGRHWGFSPGFTVPFG